MNRPRFFPRSRASSGIFTWTSAKRSRRASCWSTFSFPNWTKSTSGRRRKSSWTSGWSSRPQQLVAVAQSNIQTAIAQLAEAKANVGKYQAEVVRWESEVKRLTQMVAEKVVDRQILSETQRQLESNKAGRDAARAAVAAREADVATSRANLGKTKIDVETAKAQVKVAEADERTAAAMLAYTKVTAPYDGVVTVRNANTGDYVQAVTGDKSTPNPSAIFVVVRTDILRHLRRRPRGLCPLCRAGNEGGGAGRGPQRPPNLRHRDPNLLGHTRGQPNLAGGDRSGDERLRRPRPGMYVYTKVLVERPDVYALPQPALIVAGNQTYCYLLRSNKSIKTSVETGVSDGTWTEVDKIKAGEAWQKVTGNEEVILGDLSELTDGQAVTVAKTGAP